MCIVGLLVGMLAMLIYSDDSNDLNKILLKIAKKLLCRMSICDIDSKYYSIRFRIL